MENSRSSRKKSCRLMLRSHGDVSLFPFSFAMSKLSEILFILLILTLLIFSKNGVKSTDVVHKRVTAGHNVHEFVRTSVVAPDDTLNQVVYHQHPQRDGGLFVKAETAFTLRVQVKDAMSHQPLSAATVDTFANHSLISSAVTSSDGSALLRIPYIQGRALTIVARQDGFIHSSLPWRTVEMPLFSSVTLSLFSQNQGNIWLFEDSVLITGKISDAVPQPNVQFPRTLLSFPTSNISSLTAYLTGPQLPADKHSSSYTTGIVLGKTGYRSIELKPLAAVMVQLLYDGADVQVKGPIRITLPLHESSQSQPPDAVPAWSFDSNTGAWVNRGLGMVRTEQRGLVWVYIAPHLGYWLAAAFPSDSGYMGHENTLDFISYHEASLMAVLGGTLVVAVGLLAVVVCYCRSDRERIGLTIRAVGKRDETTCTNNRDSSLRDAEPHGEISPSAAYPSTRQRRHSDIELECSACVGDIQHPPLQIYEDISGLAPESSKHSHLHVFVNRKKIAMPVSMKEDMLLPERLIVYNQPVAILQMLERSSPSEHTSGVRSAPLTRKAIQDHTIEKPASNNSFIQTLPKSSLLSDSQQWAIRETPYGDPGLSSNPGAWSCFNSLSESVSVPETLNEAVGMVPVCDTHQRSSEQTLLQLSKSKPFPNPRAWFVSLEGTPAAQVRHSVVDLRGSPLPPDSHDASIDSGVDLNERRSGRKPGPVHSARAARGTIRARCAEDADLSSSESAATAACSTEDLSLRSVLHSSSGTIPNLPEERHEADPHECAPSPRVQRLRKPKEGRAEKQRSTWHTKEDRPRMKLH
ncbi:protein FAM171B-like [Brachyhypopomus gauderio]|uniref:protein FAM171B-like n=1 Tax=Brachyhypopomus gauderio TaxID=698409 RepID=UPI004042E0FE